MRLGRPALAYIHDVLMTGIGYTLALYLRVGDETFTTFREALVTGLPTILVSGAVVYRFVGLYRGIWRYASMPDMAKLVQAVTVVVAACTLLLFFLTRLEAVPRSLPLILWFVLLVLLGGPRFGYRLMKDRRIAWKGEKQRGRIPLLLIGAGDGADQLIRALFANRHAAYQVVGVLDDRERRVGRNIQGIPILGRLDDLDAVIRDLKDRGIQPQRLVITRPASETDGTTIRSILAKAEALGLTLSRLPDMTEFQDALGEGKIEFRPIAVEDLLGRPQAVLDRGAIAGLVGGKRVVVTGAGGTIGSELTRQIAMLAPTELVLVDSGEFNLYTIDQEIRENHPGVSCRTVLADVRNGQRILRLFEEVRPELVFHAAALKHVPLVESNPEEGILTNVIGTKNVADAARACGTQAMVLISTDKAVNPASVMGASKRIAEAYCQALDVLPGKDGAGGPTRFMTVRFGNVLGSSGSVVPLFQRQLAKGGPLTVTHPDMKRYFMTVREAVELVLQASAYGLRRGEERGRIFVLDMGEPVKIVDLARQMIRLAGLRPDEDVRIQFTGLRPGEKLSEEILLPSEAFTKTEADGIFLAAPRVIDYALLNRALNELEGAARAGDRTKQHTIITNLVPDFRSAAPDQPTTAAI